MKTSVEKLDGNTVKLTAVLPAEAVDEAIDQAYKAVSAKLKIPGFRPGKAPRPLVDSYVGQEAVLGDATEGLVQETYPKAVEAEDLRPIEPPEMAELEPVTPGEEYTWVAEVQVRPELTLSSHEGLHVDVESAEPTEAEIDEQIDSLRSRYATIEAVTDRGVGENDFVLMSFTGYVEGEEYEGNSVDKYLYQMNMGSMPDAFDEQLMGAKEGDEVRIEFAVPESSSVPEFVGKTAQFDVQVHGIKAQVMPAPDDEFAANVGGFDTIDELRTTIRERLAQEKQIAQSQAKERGVRAALAERLEGDVPEAMIKTRADSMMRDFITGLDTRGMTFEQYLQYAQVDEERVYADVTAQAEQGVREDLAMEALFRDLGMEITDADIVEELEVLAGTSEKTPEELRQQWQDLGLMPVIKEQVMHRKAVQWLLENADIEVAESEAPTESTASKSAPAEAGTKTTSGTAKKRTRAKKDEPDAKDEE